MTLRRMRIFHRENTIRRGSSTVRKVCLFLFNLKEDASAHTDDKVKLLLTLSASLSTLVLLLARNVTGGFPWAWSLVALAAAAILCLMHFGVRTYWEPDPVQNAQGGEWASQLYYVTRTTSGRTSTA